MRRLPSRGLELWILVCFVLPLQVHAQQSSPTAPTIAYPDNSEGLRQLLNRMLSVAKREDPSELHSMIRETEIPNYRSWFASNFGQEKAEKNWTKPYEQGLAKREEEFQELFNRLAHMDGEFEVEKIDTANRFDLFNGPLDGYTAYWKKPLGPTGEERRNIGDFFFVDGKFRLMSALDISAFREPIKHSVIPAKLVRRVLPIYPAEARDKKIEGTVKLQVTVQKDGSVTVQNVVQGDILLSQAAIDAVRQWRFEPWQFDGQPVEMQQTIELVFSLAN